jgi:hypothetical protein
VLTVGFLIEAASTLPTGTKAAIIKANNTSRFFIVNPPFLY